MATLVSHRPWTLGIVDTELGAFLKDRRGKRRPHEVGLPTNPGRRVPGLRREELAIVAGVSPDHYQRIEQGRVNPSPQVIDAIATALALDDTERQHLHDLARGSAGTRTPNTIRQSSPVRYQSLVDSFNGPAYALDQRRDIVAWNQLAAALHIDFQSVPPRDRNMIWLILTHPAVKALYPDWETAARTQVGLLRRASARYPDDRRLHDLIGRLSATSAEFDAWWRAREVREGTAGHKDLQHPEVGALRLSYQVLHPAGEPEIEIFVYYPTTAAAHDQLRQMSEATTTRASRQ